MVIGVVHSTVLHASSVAWRTQQICQVQTQVMA